MPLLPNLSEKQTGCAFSLGRGRDDRMPSEWAFSGQAS